MLILIVDDNPVQVALLKSYIDDVYYADTIISVSNGKEAVETVNGFHNSSNKHFGLILLDLIMPVMSGESALVEIRRLEKEWKVEPSKIVVQTCKEKHLIDGVDLDYDAYVFKPYSREKINTILRDLNLG